MTDDRRQLKDGPVREFQLEGPALYVIVAILLVVLAGVFYLGRRYERARGSSGRVGAVAGDTGLLTEPEQGGPVEEFPIEEQIDFFDTVPGQGANAEPDREAGDREAAAMGTDAPPASPEPEPVPEEPGGGPFFIQVLAARDRRSAENLQSTLSGGGFQARIHTEQDGGGTWYKVRVGGFPDRDAAAPVLEKLKQAGYKGAWTTRVD